MTKRVGDKVSGATLNTSGALVMRSERVGSATVLAQVTLVKGDLRGIAIARTLSVATVGNMKQNLLFAFLNNALGVPIAAGVLYPVTGWLVSPPIAAPPMSLSSASVIGNALLLRTSSSTIK